MHVELDRMNVGRNILQAIGNTSRVELHSVVPSGSAKVCVKLEWENPTGCMKDRMAHSMIARAEEDGRLNPGDTIVEYSGGSTGISLVGKLWNVGAHIGIQVQSTLRIEPGYAAGSQHFGYTANSEYGLGSHWNLVVDVCESRSVRPDNLTMNRHCDCKSG